MRIPERFTATEAAFLTDIPVARLRKHLDEQQAAGGSALPGRQVAPSDLLYLRLLKEVYKHLTPHGRRHLYKALAASKSERRPSVKVGRLALDVHPFQHEIDERQQRLRALQNKVTGNADDPVLRSTGTSVYRLAALLRGGMVDADVLHDYPGLTPEDLGVVRAYARIYPKRGRPYPKETLKAAIRGGGLDLLDKYLPVDHHDDGS